MSQQSNKIQTLRVIFIALLLMLVSALVPAAENNTDGLPAWLALPVTQQLSDDDLATMRGQGRNLVAVPVPGQGVILWDEDSADTGSNNSSAQQNSQVTIKVRLEGQQL